MEKTSSLYSGKCVSYTHLGMGVFVADQFPERILVSGMVPGDEGEVEISYKIAGNCFGKIKKLTVLSKDRVTPRCPVHTSCGGCLFQNVSYERQLAFKKDLVASQLGRVEGLSFEVSDPVASEPCLGVRNKVQVPFGRGRWGELIYGFYKELSHDIVPYPDCVNADPRANEVLHKVKDAAVMAKAYVAQGIFEPEVELGHKRPPLAHHGMQYNLKYMPTISEDHFPSASLPFAPCPFNLGLYPVVDSAAWVERLLALGVKTIQLRIKTPVVDDESNERLVAEIKRACFLGHSYRARVFIDDHYKLAAKYGAYGVHLGQEDLLNADLEFIREQGLRLGVSTHGIYELCKVLTLHPSYIALGHVYPTKTKDMASKPQGAARMGLQARMLKGVVPTVAIGGIKLDKAEELLEQGVDSLAVVTAITQADNPFTETQKWIAICRTGPSELYGAEPKAWHQRQDEQDLTQVCACCGK